MITLAGLCVATGGLGGCGSAASPIGAADGGRGYSATYRFMQVPPSGELEVERAEMVTDGRSRVRLNFVGGEVDMVVSDGIHALVTYSNATFEQIDAATVPGPFVVAVDNTLRSWCADPIEDGTETVLTRSATRFRCSADGHGWSRPISEVAVDNESGLVMSWVQGNLRATATTIDLHADVPDDTFSLRPPTGTRDTTHPLVQPFRVPRIGGGQLASSDYAGQPALFLIGSAPGIRAMLRRVTPVDDELATVGLLVADPPEGWQGTLLDPQDAAELAAAISAAAGPFDMPVGIDIKGTVATGLAPDWSRVSGLTALVLVDADGAVALTADDRISGDDLGSAIRHLKEAGTP